MPTQPNDEHAAPPDDGSHAGAHTQIEQTVIERGRGHETQASENIGDTPLQPRHTNKGLLLFWAAIVVFSVALVVLARAYL
jgi:hypothetical protein